MAKIGITAPKGFVALQRPRVLKLLAILTWRWWLTRVQFLRSGRVYTQPSFRSACEGEPGERC